ncbi:MAG: hypothetical protein MNPFHGCM_02010 [Gemmatimonadaceae bacterium]|nr:hypothetical protein [Gemmatimonadaceae bacterium]
MSQHHGTDKKAAMTGFVVTAVLLFLMAFTIVKLTNAKYAGASSEHTEATK